MNNYIELNGNRYWYLENDIQRPYKDDIEWINGQFCIKGKLVHREDGSAVEWSNGDNEYYQYGKRHRVGGPAVEWADGDKAYWKMVKYIEKMAPLLSIIMEQEKYTNIGYVIRSLRPRKI